MSVPQIEFDRSKLEKLKKEYATAVAGRREAFEFEGQELLTAYAKYLIEYLEQQLPKE